MPDDRADRRGGRALLRRMLLTGPCRLYKRGEETGGAVPWIVLIAMTSTVAAASAAGALTALIFGRDASEGAYVAGMSAGALWFVTYIYTLVLVGVLRLRGRSVGDYVGENWKRRPRRWWDG